MQLLFGMVVLLTDILITLMTQVMQAQHLILKHLEYVMEQLLAILIFLQLLQKIQLKLMLLLFNQGQFGGVVILTLPLNKLLIYQDKQFSQLLLILLLLGITMEQSSGWDLLLTALIMYILKIILTLQCKLTLVQSVFALVLILVLEAQLEQEQKTQLPKTIPSNALEILVSLTLNSHVLNKFFNLMIRQFFYLHQIMNPHGKQKVQLYGMDLHLTNLKQAFQKILS